jgi:hypothetical protein
VVRVGFDPQLASGGLIDLARLAGPTAAAVRELAVRTSGPGSGEASAELVEHPCRLPLGLHVPALVVGAGPRSARTSRAARKACTVPKLDAATATCTFIFHQARGWSCDGRTPALPDLDADAVLAGAALLSTKRADR